MQRRHMRVDLSQLGRVTDDDGSWLLEGEVRITLADLEAGGRFDDVSLTVTVPIPDGATAFQSLEDALLLRAWQVLQETASLTAAAFARRYYPDEDRG